MIKKVQVFAVIRIDHGAYQEQDITVKEILPTMQEASVEVERLNRLNESKDARYFCQATRYFPEGRKIPGREEEITP